MSQLLNEKNSDISKRLQYLLQSDSELGSQLLSLLIVSNENSKEIIDAINKNSIKKQVINDESTPRSLHASSAGSEEAVNAYSSKNDEKSPQELLLEKRRKNIEASARFRQRKKLKEQETRKKWNHLSKKVKDLNAKIDDLLIENQYWKERLDKINEQKSSQLLYEIKLKNTN